MPARHPDVEFLRAAMKPEEFPSLGLPEVALVGRSNVGKSSLLNAIAGGRKAARTSRTPGRTRSVNYYRAGILALVDLPGYGYAKVSKVERERWKSIVESYLTRPEISLTVLIVDARTGATELDQMIAQWLRHHDIPTTVVVTKLDKLGRAAAGRAVAAVAATLALPVNEVMGVSAVTRAGVPELWRAIEEAVKSPAGGP